MSKCILCLSPQHIVDQCPKLGEAQKAFAMASAKVTYNNQPRDTFHVLIESCDATTHRAFWVRAGDHGPLQIWSGRPGIISRAPLEYTDSKSFEVTYGTGVIGRSGGDDGYDVVHDESQRGPVVKIVEDDGKHKTVIYVDVAAKDATVGDHWVKNFISN